MAFVLFDDSTFTFVWVHCFRKAYIVRIYEHTGQPSSFFLDRRYK